MSRKSSLPPGSRALSTALSLLVILAPGFTAEAGDISRGGFTSAPAPGTASGGASTAIIATPGATSAKDVLARTTQALQAVQNMQAAARSLALAGPNHLRPDLPDVPDGLTAGGLQVALHVPANLAHPAVGEDPTLWQGAGLPQQSAANGQTTVTVTQTAQQALLNWQTFNVGQHTTLDFDQSAGGDNVGQWVAFNKINDPAGRPSQILGSIQAQGQVYVINSNGIIFGGSSQVNTHALVASSLPINDNLIARGLLNNPDQQFLFSALPIPAGTNGPTNAFDPTSSIPSNGVIGNVEIQAGAQLSAPTTSDHVGGRIALIGPNVINAGTILTPDGQTILAAGLQVGLAAHPSTDPTLRGLDVYVGEVADASLPNQPGSGTATNTGLMQTPRGNATITGQTVNQLGFIDSSTSVSYNGRIDLLADYNAAPVFPGNNLSSYLNPTAAGAVVLGPGSVAQVLPELADTDRTVGTSLALPSLINIQGNTIHLASADPGTGAVILAPGATTTGLLNPALSLGPPASSSLNAGVTLNAGDWIKNTSDPSTDGYGFFNGHGQIYLDPGAAIDASGSQDVAAAVSENVVAVQLRGTELANSPLQRDGALRGQTVQVDVRQNGTYNGQAWAGTPLADTTGYINLITHSVGELTTAGGTVSLNAGDSVVMQPGSTVNVSGGWIDYQGGVIQTTQVVSGGHLMDISKATPDLVYGGIYTGTSTITDAKWGVTETFASPVLLSGAHYEQSYIQGGNGGGISITAPSAALDGSLLGNTVAGPHQQTPDPQVVAKFSGTTIGPTMESILSAPIPAALSLSFQGNDPLTANKTVSPTPPSITFQPDPSQAPAASFQLDNSGNPLPLSSDRQSKVVLAPDLIGTNGFGRLTISNGDGDITVPAGVSLATPAGGGIDFTADNITIDGQVTAPAGTLSFTVDDFSPFAAPTLVPGTDIPVVDPSRGHFALATNASLSTAGLIVDERAATPSPGTLPLFTDGGTVTIKAYQVDLPAGSSIDVSGGVQMSATGKPTYGAGGTITIDGGQDPIDNRLGQIPTLPQNLLGHLVLDATLTGYSGKTGSGGTLNILAPLIQIGGSQLLNGDQATSGQTLWLNQTAANGDLLQPDFFSKGGFYKFSLTGQGGFATDASGNFMPYQFMPGVVVAPGAVIAPQVSSWMATTTAEGGLALAPALLPVGQRTPANLMLTAHGVDKVPLLPDASVVGKLRGDLVINPGAVIQTDPLGSITLNGDTVAMLGSGLAPGGTVKITGGKITSTIFADPKDASLVLPTVDLGANSILSTAGTTVLTPDLSGRGLRTGRVVDGGTIAIDGNIVAEAGARLDASGASDQFDVLSSYTGATTTLNTSATAAQVVRVQEDSNGGSISLQGEEELFTDATLRGFAGGSSALGGTLAIASGRNGGNPTLQNSTLVLTQSGPTIPGAFYDSKSGQNAIGNPVLEPDGTTPVSGEGYFAADSFSHGGFAALTLGGSVQYSGAVTLTASESLTVGSSGVMFADSNVANSSLSLNAPYVAIGTAFLPPLQAGDPAAIPFQAGGQPVYVPPTYGSGRLSVAASLIDVGNLSLQNIGQASFIANNGDIRGDGTLDVQGNVSLSAGQIYAPTATTFSIVAYPASGPAQSGAVTITGAGSRPLPWSAGGTLNIFASSINQGGVLRAPFGRINLGWDGSGTQPWTDPITGVDSTGNPLLPLPVTTALTLSAGSVTSTSAIDPTTGKALVLPYGIDLNGTQWIDPTGTDITLTGVQFAGAEGSQVNLSALKVDAQQGSSIDIRGGGDLYAYQWVSGTGGTTDILASNTSFAIIPGYQANYAPFAPYNTSSAASNLLLDSNGRLTDPGYFNPALQAQVGDQIYLNAGNGLPAGTYTLLPARYALLPGAYLVTPAGTPPAGTVAKPDGSVLVSGYRFNAFNPPGMQPLFSSFELAANPAATTSPAANAPASVVRSRAEYDDFFADTYISQNALQHNLAVPPLPIDSGQLLLTATTEMTLEGTLAAKSLSDSGRGGLVDINSPVDIYIEAPGKSGPAGLTLNSSDLSAFGADSLLIGGVRQATSGGTAVTVTTSNLTVDNAGAPLTGPDIILAANQNLTITAGSEVEQSGALSGPAQALLPGNANTAGSGNGALLRVSSDPSAQIVRAGVDSSTAPQLTIGAGAKIAGASVTLDSTSATSLDPAAVLGGQAIILNSGQISLQLGGGGNPQGLVLSSGTLQALQNSASSLSLLSYSSIDIYGTGQIGALDSAGQPTFASLALHAGEIRGFNTGGGSVTFSAQNILLDNSPNRAGAGPVIAPNGTLVFNAGTLQLGANQLSVDQYANVSLNGSHGILVQGPGGLTAQGDLGFTSPLITGASAANQTITAGGVLTLQSAGTNATVVPGLGASLTLQGASITANSSILLPSGSLTLHATGGDVSVNGSLDVSGTAQTFFDSVKYTNGGQISLTADTGNIILGTGSTVNVAAQTAAGSAGSLSVSTVNGTFTDDGMLLAQSGASGQSGTFALDIGSIPGGSLAPLSDKLFNGGFTQSISIRDRTDPLVTIDGLTTAHAFNLSADQGSITVAGTGVIDAGGATGGTIDLEASGNVTLAPGSLLTAAGQNFDDAGKGGSVSLEAGSYEAGSGVNTSAIVDIQSGAKIDLSVASNTQASASLGDFTGTLHLRESQAAFGTGAQFNSLGSNVNGASSIVLEGFQVYDLSGTNGASSTNGAITSIGSGGIIDTSVENAIKSNGTAFASNVDPALPGNALFHVEPGAEIVNNGTATNTLVTLYNSSTIGQSSVTFGVGANTKVAIPGGMPALDSIKVSTACKVTYADGTTSNTIPANTAIQGANSSNSPVVSLNFATAGSPKVSFTGGSTPFAFALGTTSTNIVKTTGFASQVTTLPGDLTLANTWDLSTYRFGPNITPAAGSGEPGILTLRAKGNLVFNFDASLNDGFDPSNPVDATKPLWTAPLLPAPARSWSYRLVAGADYSAADPSQVRPLAAIGSTAGSLLFGEGSPSLPVSTGSSVTRATIIPQFYQVIRTGTGDIDISTGRDLELLNPLATIYTAGQPAATLADFDSPVLSYTLTGTSFQTLLGNQGPVYPAQYSLDGGNVTISAQHDIIHETSSGAQDSSKQLPDNWLYRRGYVNPSGQFAPTNTANIEPDTGSPEVASTSWWSDFSNFFEGIGTFGGGNVTLLAGHDVSNVDAVVPTNARMPKGTPNAANLIELGGGDLLVQAGHDINGGVYYVERGSGTLSAGNSVHTNSTRAAVPTAITNADATAWLPTTLFLGQGSFNVTAGGDLLLGPVANPFLLPQGLGNTFFDKTYFSTYAATDAVDVSSLTGAVTLKDNADAGLGGSLIDWYNQVLTPKSTTLAGQQPWLDLVEATVLPKSGYFTAAAALMPGTLRVTTFSGDLNLVGSLTLSPSASGTVDFNAAGSINGFQPNGLSNISLPPSASNTFLWGSSTINLSDADPNRLPGITTPSSAIAATTGSVTTQRGNWAKTSDNLLQNFPAFFNESGSSEGTFGVLQTQQALHADLPLNPNDPNSPLGPLHASDPIPVHLYAQTGDVSGVTLFSGKAANVAAGKDITDIALYIQNDQASDISLITAGRDILAFDPNSSLRLEAQTPGNKLLVTSLREPGPGDGTPTAGDIQISGPGALEVLAGRNLDLGAGASNVDGTSVGLTSIGNARNPSLPFGGASVTVGAGVGDSGPDFTDNAGTGFIDRFLNPANGDPEAMRYLPVLGSLLGLTTASNAQIWDAFSQLSVNAQDRLALHLFYLVLRDAGRDHNDQSSPGFGNYNAGFVAIAALFPGNTWQGDISLSSRDLKTENGGDITVFAPGGGLTLGFQLGSAGQAPPGIVTEHGGDISIFTRDNVNVGALRIFTLRGGNEIIWASRGDIAAGRSSKTVQTAPPTEVLIDPQSADVKTDLAGLATGGGIGVLAAVTGVPVGNVDLIAPAGTVDAGDAGIRASGNLNIAAAQVLNASNIQVGGTSAGTPAAPAAPSLGSLTAGANTAAAATNAADEAAKQQARGQAQPQDLPSIITVEVLGYGGGDDSN